MTRNTFAQPFGMGGCLFLFIAAIIIALIAFGIIRGWEQPGSAASPSPLPVAASSPSGLASQSPKATETPTSTPTVTAFPTSSPSATTTATAVAPVADEACPLAAAALQRRIDEPAADEKESVERNIELYRAISDVTSGQVSDDFATMANLQGQYLDLIAPFGYDFRAYLAAGDTAAFGLLVAELREPQQRAAAFLMQTCGIDYFGGSESPSVTPAGSAPAT